MSVAWTTSRALYQKRHYVSTILGMQVKLVTRWSRPCPDDKVIGWGLKPSAVRAKQWADNHALPLIRIEDGFLGYLGHPADKGIPLSLAIDASGIYYSAQSQSQLTQWLSDDSWFDRQERLRAVRLLRRIRQSAATKYNRYQIKTLPPYLQHQLAATRHRVLLIDQIAGDLAIAGALATEEHFLAMLEAAKADYPDSDILIRSHPDTQLKGRRSILGHAKAEGVTIISDECHPHALLNAVDVVYTVSSLLGFEALLLGKPVVCFGASFYAGLGLTDDRITIPHRPAKPVSLLQLVSAALIKYCRYQDPRTSAPCEPEVIIDLIEAQYSPLPPVKKLYASGFSLWKQSFIRRFCRSLTQEILFCKRPPEHIAEPEQHLVWGMRFPEQKNAWRLEDGFIRSIGLGSDLSRPHSLVIDPVGIYFNAQSPSYLEQLLQQERVTPQQRQQASRLRELLISGGISKYNTGSSHCPPLRQLAGGRKILLVIGQVDDDASLIYGSPHIEHSQGLLEAVRKASPASWIVYKPHPDVLSGNRSSHITDDCKSRCVDFQLDNVSLAACLPEVDELHTLTSLSGFEALLRGTSVVVWGHPFYSGWGLTHDVFPLERRKRLLTLDELTYIVLYRYPRYFDWHLGCFTTADVLCQQLLDSSDDRRQQSTSIMAKKLRKLGFLLQTLFAR